MTDTVSKPSRALNVWFGNSFALSVCLSESPAPPPDVQARNNVSYFMWMAVSPRLRQNKAGAPYRRHWLLTVDDVVLAPFYSPVIVFSSVPDTLVDGRHRLQRYMPCTVGVDEEGGRKVNAKSREVSPYINSAAQLLKM